MSAHKHGICSMTTVVRCPRTGHACSEPTCQERHWRRKMFERGLSHRGLPLKRKLRPRCCAKTRAGAPCIMRVVPGKRLPIREFILATRHEKIILRAMRQWIATLLLIVGGSCWAADAIVKDGDTLILGDTSYKLDGIDAPEPDQVCLAEKGTIWRWGSTASGPPSTKMSGEPVVADAKDPRHAYSARGI